MINIKNNIDKIKAQELLNTLVTLLKDDDASAIDIIDELHDLSGVDKYSNILNKLTKAIEAYDFSLGLEISQELSFVE